MNWIAEIHSENDKLSSKRIYGGLLIVSVIICAFLNINNELITSMLYIGATLIGLGTTVSIAKAVMSKKAIEVPDQQIRIIDHQDAVG